MRLIYREPNISNALRLKAFISRGAPLAFTSTHPLGPAFRGLEKMLRGQEHVSDFETGAVADLDLKAEWILRLAGSHPRDYELRGDLRNSERCRALMFEVTVITYLVEQNVRSVHWRRYEQGVSDIATEGPPLQIECKLVTGEVTIDRILKRAFRNSHQSRPGEGAFVLVAGAQTPLEPRDHARALQWMNGHAGDWFRKHRSVGFVVVMLPLVPPEGSVTAPLGVQGSLFDLGRVIALRSEVAEERTPEGFHFRA